MSDSNFLLYLHQPVRILTPRTLSSFEHLDGSHQECIRPACDLMKCKFALHFVHYTLRHVLLDISFRQIQHPRRVETLTMRFAGMYCYMCAKGESNCSLPAHAHAFPWYPGTTRDETRRHTKRVMVLLFRLVCILLDQDVQPMLDSADNGTASNEFRHTLSRRAEKDASVTGGVTERVN